ESADDGAPRLSKRTEGPAIHASLAAAKIASLPINYDKPRKFGVTCLAPEHDVNRTLVLTSRQGPYRRPADLLPGEDSNLQPTDYPLPEVSLGRGLSHRHRLVGLRRWALSL